jgi:alpha-N-acetylglucosamine transferase
VFVKDSPVDEYKVLVNNHDLFVSNKGNGCCEFKEWLKLYSYTTTEYPLVVTLDLDTIVLKPMDELVDHMIRSSSYKQEPFVHAMWKATEAKQNQRVDFAFTRDDTIRYITNITP